MRLLARWPIRRKFYAALGLLSVIVLLLAISGLQGLYAFRNAANSISRRAIEMPLAQRVAKASSDVSTSFNQNVISYPTGEDRIANSPTIGPDHDLTGFRIAIADLRIALDAYKAMLQASDSEDTVLGDRSQELAALAQIEEHLKRISSLDQHKASELGFFRTVSLQHEIHELHNEALELPMIFQKRMASFREEVRGRYRAWMLVAWFSMLSAVAIFVALWWIFRRMVMHPFRQLMTGCRLMCGDIQHGNFQHRIQLGTQDELDELATALNQMADRFQDAYQKLQAINRDLDQQVRERTNEVVRSERLASVGYLAAGVSHEINNPMAAIAWSAEALESRLHDVLHATEPRPLDEDQVDALRENLRRIQQEAFRCKEITERLLDFSRLGEVQPKPTELRTLVKDVAAMVSTVGQFRNKSIQVIDGSAVNAAVNPQEIKQVVLNLLTNAMQSLGDQGHVRIRIWRDPDAARIRIEDDGCGMTDEVRQHLFEPFFTRRRDGRGTGLGLSISYRIVQQHGGRLEAYSDGPGKGTRMDVYLPLGEVKEQTHEQRQAAA